MGRKNYGGHEDDLPRRVEDKERGRCRLRGSREDTTMKRANRKRLQDLVRKGNVIESAERQNDWGIEKAPSGRRATTLPKSFSLYGRQGYNHWWAREVTNQRQTGSCVGHAGAAMLRFQLVAAKKATRSSRDSNFPSEQFAWQASKEMDEYVSHPSTMIQFAGTSLKAVSEVLRKWGCVSRKIMPFGKMSDLTEAKFLEHAAKWKIKSFHAVSPWVEGEQQFNEYGLKWWLVNHGPVLVRMNVNQAFFNMRRNSGVLGDLSKKTGYWHAVLIVGYSEHGVLIRNSWGKSWGEYGHCWVSWEYAKLMFPEMYGWVVEKK